jgi:hypothetical protein
MLGSIAFKGKALYEDGKKPLRHGVTEILKRNLTGNGHKPVGKLCVSARPGAAGRAGVTPW